MNTISLSFSQDSDAKHNLFKILSIPKDRRTSRDIEFIFKNLKHLDFMKAFSETDNEIILTNVLKSLTFKEVPQGEIIYRYGDMPSFCHVIISGSVELSQPKAKIFKYRSNSKIKIKETENDFDSLKKMTFSYNSSKKEINNRLTRFYSSISEKKNCIGENDKVIVLYEGQLFGDKEIIENKKRNFTAKAENHCLLGQISKLDYLNIFENVKRLERTDELKFLQNVEIIKTCHRSTINQIKQMFFKQTFKSKDVVVHQNSEVENVFLIKKGNFEVVYQHNFTFSTDFDINYFIRLNSKDERFSTQRTYELKNSYKQNEEFKLLIIGPGEFFGITELKNGQKYYNFSLVSRSNRAEIMICKKDDFLSLSKVFLYKLFNNSTSRENHLKKRIIEIKNNRDLNKRNKYHQLILRKTSSKKEIFDKQQKFSNSIENISDTEAIVNKNKKSSLLGSFYEINEKSISRLNSPCLKSPVTNKEKNSSNDLDQIKIESNTIEAILEDKNCLLEKPIKYLSESKRIMTAQPKCLSRFNSAFKSNKSSQHKFVTFDHIKNQNIPNIKYQTISLKSPVSNSIFAEDDKKNFMKCFEINKKFLLTNNTSMIYSSFTGIFPDYANPPQRNQNLKKILKDN